MFPAKPTQADLGASFLDVSRLKQSVIFIPQFLKYIKKREMKDSPPFSQSFPHLNHALDTLPNTSRPSNCTFSNDASSASQITAPKAKPHGRQKLVLRESIPGMEGGRGAGSLRKEKNTHKKIDTADTKRVKDRAGRDLNGRFGIPNALWGPRPFGGLLPKQRKKEDPLSQSVFESSARHFAVYSIPTAFCNMVSHLVEALASSFFYYKSWQIHYKSIGNKKQKRYMGGCLTDN